MLLDTEACSLTLHGRVKPRAVTAYSASAFFPMLFRRSMSHIRCLRGGRALLPTVITVVAMLVLFHTGPPGPAMRTMHNVPSAARAAPTSQRPLRVAARPGAPVAQRKHALGAPVPTGSAVPMGHARAGPRSAPDTPDHVSVAMAKAHRMSWLPVCALGAWLALAAGRWMYSRTRTWARASDSGPCVYGATVGAAHVAARSTGQGPPTARLVEMGEDGGQQWPLWPPVALAAVTGAQAEAADVGVCRSAAQKPDLHISRDTRVPSSDVLERPYTAGGAPPSPSNV